MSEIPEEQAVSPNQDEELFLRARFAGGRFDAHALPFDILPDLAAYRSLIVAVAKMLFKQRHDSRVRVPKGFEESFTLALTAVRGGSSAIVEARLTDMASLRNQPQGNLGFVRFSEFEDARVYVDDLIRRVSKTGDVPADFPVELAGKFNAFGQNLRSDEFIELGVEPLNPVRYDSVIRRNIVLSREQTYENTVDDFFVLNGFIADTGTVHVRDATGQLLDFRPLTGSEFEKAKARASERVKLVGTGLFDSSDKLRRLIDVQVIYSDDESEAFEFHARLDQIARAEAGWFDGENPAPSPEAVEAMRSALSSIGELDEVASRPHLYPSPEGGVAAEWDHNGWSASLDVFPSSNEAKFHATHLSSRETFRESIGLRDQVALVRAFGECWNRINSHGGSGDAH